jgi:hypothetical protein
MHWREWEKAIEALFRANAKRWLWIHLPRLPTKALNQRLPKNLPDYIAVGKIGSDREGWLLAIEAKTGSGEQSEGQGFFMRCILAVPGVRGGVFYPHQRAALVELIGEEIVG